MSVITSRYTSKPTRAEAVQVTEENVLSVAAWCGGQIFFEGEESSRKAYIQVKVSRPVNKRQTQAEIGDYVVKIRDSFKVYTEKSFKRSFNPEQPRPVVVVNQSKPTPAVMNNLVVARNAAE